MSPELENALFAYYRKRRLRDLLCIVIASCCLLPAIFGALATPVDARPIAAFGIPGALGLLIGLVSLGSHRAYLLAKLRGGTPIGDIRRGASSMDEHPAQKAASLHVDFTDGTSASLSGLRAEELTHLEALLRSQIRPRELGTIYSAHRDGLPG